MKKILMGTAPIIVLMIGGLGYWFYQHHEEKKFQQFIQEREKHIEKIADEMIQEGIQFRETENARKERIKQGLGKVEYIIQYRNDRRNDTRKEEEYTLVEGRKHGRYTSWFDSERIKSIAEYNDGELVGEEIKYFDLDLPEPAIQAITQYKHDDNGVLFGFHEILYWDEHGLKRQEIYRNDHFPETNFTTTWGMNGELQLKLYVESDSKLNVHSAYSRSGQKRFEFRYDDMWRSNGWCYHWAENGELIRKGFIKDDEEQHTLETIGFDSSVECTYMPVF